MELLKIRPPPSKIMFIYSCTSYKLESVTIRESGDFHKQAVHHQQELAKPVEESRAAKSRKSLHKDQFDKLNKLFRIVHALAVNNRPPRDYPWKIELSELLTGESRTEAYRNTMRAQKFLSYIGFAVFSSVANHVKNSPFISLMSDDTTDISAQEQSMCFIRTALCGHIKNISG